MDIHLNGQVVQTLVVLFLLDRAVFEEGCQQCHLPVVKGPALFLWGQDFPCCLVRRVHRATVLTAFSIVSRGRVGFKIGLETMCDFTQRRAETGGRHAEKPVESRRKKCEKALDSRLDYRLPRV